jgi:hypothetical protein
VFLLGNGADRVDVPLDIPGNELTIATHATLQVDKVVRVADSANALGDLRALLGEALVLVASGFDFLRNLLDTRCHLWGAPWTPLCWLVVGTATVLWHTLERLFRLNDCLLGSSLFRGHGGGDSLAQFMLHMEEVRRVMRPQVVLNIRQQAWGFITGRLNHFTVEPQQSLFHEFLPGVLIACLRRLLQQNIVAHGLNPHQA